MMLKEAIEYVNRGFYIFPLHSIREDLQCTCGAVNCSDAGKHPRVSRGLKEASRDLAIIEKWFGEGSEPSNIGIVTGEVSGITVIDIDIGEGKFGAESWAEAIKDHGEPDTLMSKTGSGGMHVIFSYNSALKTSVNTLGKGVDVRNDGGYIVAPPSLHRSGEKYEWLNPETPIAILPSHLSRRKETRGRKRKDDMYNSKYSLEQVASMLESVPNDDRDLWRSVGIILGRTFHRIDEAWEIYNAWSEKGQNKKGRNHDSIMREAFYELSQISSEKELTLGTIVKAAIDGGWSPKTGEVPIGNFIYYGPGNNYIYRPTISYWVAAAVDAAVSPVNDDGKIIKASEWLKKHQLVTSMTADPSIEDDYTRGKDCRNGEVVTMAGAALFNTYRPATIELGDARLAKPFIDHCFRVFNKFGDADQFLNYMAHRVQKPWEKTRFALLLAGEQGVGKDTAVEFCCPAIGVWNVASIEPSSLDSGFNEYAAATLIRISEAANLAEMTKWAFNERTKVLIAGNPDSTSINPKYGQKYTVRMFNGVIITTNHLSSGIYIPAGDRRYDVIECATMQEMGFTTEEKMRAYFGELWEWFIAGGDTHTAAFLSERDISGFSSSNGQRKTEAHKTVVAGGMITDHWLDDILCEMNYPDFVRADSALTAAENSGMKIAEARGKLSNAMSRLGYSQHRNPSSQEGRWAVNGKKFIVYVKAGKQGEFDLSKVEREMF
jgi:Bifunctional DNA primase/polymerase, N-terminal/Family of unknown function (DUF5906)